VTTDSIRNGSVILVATGIGASIAYGLTLWSRRAAQAAVNVRPALADVGPVDAFFSGHLGDWLFYHYPTAMTVVTVVLFAVLSATSMYVTLDP